MKFSMNGYRRQLSGDIKTLRDIISNVVNDEHFDERELIDAVNAVISHSNIINCVYNTDDPDFVDMGDVKVNFIGK